MEIITGTERRRRWRDEDKLRIVAEAEAPDAVFALVARRHDISRGQLWKWRGQVRRGELARVPVEPEFIPVRMMASAALSMPRGSGKSASVDETDADPVSHKRAARSEMGRIEIVLPDGTCVRVDDGVGIAALRRVMTAVRR
ncbi:MAG: transposase [Acidiphilium sp.]|nr:transposase [Acidiphilium sp.]